MNYNKWYIDTYDIIFKMADWSRFDADIPNKVICIFAWMPQTIMNIKAKGGKKLWEEISLKRVQSATSQLNSSFTATKSENFCSYEGITSHIDRLYSGMTSVLRSTATSKYLHFSHPRLFPMWDSEIKRNLDFKDTSEHYMHLIRYYKEKHSDQNLREQILKEYPQNFVRAFDLYLMKNR